MIGMTCIHVWMQVMANQGKAFVKGGNVYLIVNWIYQKGKHDGGGD